MTSPRTPTVERAREMANRLGGYPQAWSYTQEVHGRTWLPCLIAAEALDILDAQMKEKTIPQSADDPRPETRDGGIIS